MDHDHFFRSIFAGALVCLVALLFAPLKIAAFLGLMAWCIYVTIISFLAI